jgi:hypothetical protein
VVGLVSQRSPYCDKIPPAKVKVRRRCQSLDTSTTIIRDDNISGYFPDIAHRISPICISIMPTSLSKASVTDVYCENVALVIF